MTRLHPFAHFTEIADTWFPSIRAEAKEQYRDPRDRVQFTAMPSVQRALQDIEDPAFLEEQPGAAEDYLAVLSALFTFWHGGQQTVGVTKDQFDESLADHPRWSRAPTEDRDFYVQLPEHWFWAQIEDGAPHEPIDGLFVSTNTTTRELSLLSVLGLRKDRNNFSQIHVLAAFDDLGDLADALPSPPFEPVVEGGAAAGVKSVSTTAEALALALISLCVTDL